MKKRFLYISIAVVALAIVIVATKFTKSSDNETELYAQVKRGKFEVIVSTTGELQSANSENIQGPSGLGNRDLRIREIKIQDLIAEGTVVDSGDYVASLDRSEVMVKLKDVEDELEKVQSQYVKTQLDTTIKLRDLRDDIISKRYQAEEAKIKLEQSKYEPPATIRQAEIELEKIQRSLNQAKKNYKLKVKQAVADMREVEINKDKQMRKRDKMLALINEFTIFAPKKGMVIYSKEWGGKKRKVGSTINPWDLTVATLPDLSQMISKTYVNEIDISKVRKGQKVKIGVDAFPDKEYNGIVKEVANVGEQLPNTDSKVFEVVVRVDGTDAILRPGMTTSNTIIISEADNVMFLPIESVNKTDSLSFVYTRSGKKQIVIIGQANENHVVIKEGLKVNDKVLLSEPDNPKRYDMIGLELYNKSNKKDKQANANSGGKDINGKKANK